MRGYTLRIAKQIEEGDPDNLGVQLGRFCLDNDIPVLSIADRLGVTKVTIYNWFAGGTIRNPSHVAAVRAVLGLETAVD